MSMTTLVPLRPSWLPMTLVPETRLTDAEFEELCFSNDLIQFERTRDGEIVMNPPTAGGTSDSNAEVIAQLRVWWKTHRRGRVFDSNGGFFLPDGSMLSPDAAYVLPATIEGISREDLKHFLHLAPDFVIELVSISDRRSKTEAKMQAWIANGVKLAWMIDPYSRSLTVYSPHASPITHTSDFEDGSGPVEGFRLDLNEVWNCYEI